VLQLLQALKLDTNCGENYVNPIWKIYLFCYHTDKLMGKHILKILMLGILLIIPAVIGASETFFRDLRRGSRGEDVKQLQIFLNSDKKTKIAGLGAGSQGRGTVFFGLKTRGALIKFQRQNNLLAEKGYLGVLTRRLLNEKVNKVKTGAPAAIKIFQPEADNKNLADDVLVPPASGAGGAKNDKTTLNLSVSAVTKQLENPLTNIFSFFPPPPKRSITMDIDYINPVSGGYGEIITIKGHGFSKTSNKIHTGYDIIDGVASSDGETLSFIFKAFQDVVREQKNNPQAFSKGYSWPFWIYVENETGISREARFEFKI